MSTQPLILQLEAIVADHTAMAKASQHKDLSDLPKADRQALVTRAVAAVVRVAGESSTYAREVDRLIKNQPELAFHTSSVVGVVKGLLADLQAGHLRSLIELIHAETFGDFLDMAQHLLDAGYKDAAAVLSGSALEAHLRALSSKSGLALETTKPDGTLVPKKADLLNSELASANAYSKLDQKNVTAWLDLRNRAAHGKYAEYQSEQVALMLASIRNFMARVPA